MLNVTINLIYYYVIISVLPKDSTYNSYRMDNKLSFFCIVLQLPLAP